MAEIVLKVKTKIGQHVMRDLSHNHTISDLKKVLCNKCDIAAERLVVLSGFPPKPLNLSNETQSLKEAGISSGDTLIVEEKQPSADASTSLKTPEVPQENMLIDAKEASEGILLRKVVPADNSCLFTSVGFVFSGKIDTSVGDFMRQMIVEHVRADPVEFSEAILGKPPAEYCLWILNPASWGGAIELAILSKYYGVEIAVVDSQNGIINRFGEDQNYPCRVLLIFDGIHYDPLYLESTQTGEMKTLFPAANDGGVLAQAEQLARESKSSRQFTDVQKFSIRCLVCQVVLVGQMAASDHAKQTGHVDFGEVV